MPPEQVGGLQCPPDLLRPDGVGPEHRLGHQGIRPWQVVGRAVAPAHLLALGAVEAGSVRRLRHVGSHVQHDAHRHPSSYCSGAGRDRRRPEAPAAPLPRDETSPAVRGKLRDRLGVLQRRGHPGGGAGGQPACERSCDRGIGSTLFRSGRATWSHSRHPSSRPSCPIEKRSAQILGSSPLPSTPGEPLRSRWSIGGSDDLADAPGKIIGAGPAETDRDNHAPAATAQLHQPRPARGPPDRAGRPARTSTSTGSSDTGVRPTGTGGHFGEQ